MALFAVENSQQTQVTFLGKYFDGPLVIILLISFGVGILSTFLAMLPGIVLRTLELSKCKSRTTELSLKVEALEKQLADRETPGKKEIDHEQIHHNA